MTQAGNSRERATAEPAALGFITVVAHEQHGLFGGLLLLTPVGRPLEFHCTAPVKPNRAQEILFGSTLRPYLYGEQIARTLLEQVQGKLLAAFTDLEPVLAAREFVELPLVMVHLVAERPSDEEAKATQLRFDAPHTVCPRPGMFRCGRNSLGVAPGFPDDEPHVIGRLAGAAERLDLLEPFARIREAIEEAQRSGR